MFSCLPTERLITIRFFDYKDLGILNIHNYLYEEFSFPQTIPQHLCAVFICCFAPSSPKRYAGCLIEDHKFPVSRYSIYINDKSPLFLYQFLLFEEYKSLLATNADLFDVRIE